VDALGECARVHWGSALECAGGVRWVRALSALGERAAPQCAGRVETCSVRGWAERAGSQFIKSRSWTAV
jgi:hypothetical protein